MIKKKDLWRRIEELEGTIIQAEERNLARYQNKGTKIDELATRTTKLEKSIKQVTVILEHLLEKQTEKELVSLIDKFGAILDKFFSKSEEKYKKCANEQKRGRGRPLGSKNKNKKEGK